MVRVHVPLRRFHHSFSALAVASAALLLSSAGVLADDAPAADGSDPGVGLESSTATFGGGASPEEQARTVRHWFGRTVNPVNGVTYGYNMVGFNPQTNRSATIGVDVIPLDLTVGGRTFSGSNLAPAVLASPLFQAGDYTVAARATSATGGSGVGGPLSAGNTGVQLLDATMRTQFDKVGTNYHVILDPTVLNAAALTVPVGMGLTMTSPGRVTYGLVDEQWIQGVIDNELSSLQLDPRRLALFLTYDIVLYTGGVPSHCCVLGAHGAGSASGTGDPTAGRHGNEPLRTFVWGSWLTAGFFSPFMQWAKQDIHSLSHELVEWATDPYTNNTVQTWFSPENPQYGCSNLLETGDPVLNIAFAVGTNTFDQNHWSDGMFHPSDEALLPWFMRSNPETQASQTSAGGRLTFMGDLNPFANFHQAPAAC